VYVEHKIVPANPRLFFGRLPARPRSCAKNVAVAAARRRRKQRQVFFFGLRRCAKALRRGRLKKLSPHPSLAREAEATHGKKQ
jgi:hypothetical protein